MQPKKYDSFSPKRATNIDGFFAKPASSRPRRPVFRASSAQSQPKPAKLADMPKRAQPQSVLTTASQAQKRPIIATDGSTEQGGLAPKGRRRAGMPVQLSSDSDGAKRQKRRGSGEQKEPKEKRSKKRTVKRTFAFFGALVLLTGLWFGFKFYRDIAHVTGNNNPLSLLKVFKPVALKNDNGRVNVLVAANSADDVGHNGANLTDSIMVLSVDTKKNTALMLSIPRDLWVNIPGVGHAKINAAYPNGGMDTLQSVVQDNLGLTIHYQALVNYGAFRDLVNAVGGISIKIESDDPRGIYDSSLDWTSRTCCSLAKYPNGPVALDGKQALNLARARGEGYNSYGYAQADFTRTMYQRKMLLAIKDKGTKTSVIANPFKVASMVDAIGNNVKTNLQVNEIQTLYTYMKKIDDNKIDSYNVNTLKGENTTMLANYTAPDGQSALTPAAGVDDFTAVQAQIQKILTADPIEKEMAVVVVLNGTDTAGLASREQTKLGAKGIEASAGDAPANQSATTVIDNSQGKMPNTLAYIKNTYKANIVTNTSLTAGYPSADFIIILGQSAVPKATTNQ